MTHPPFSARHRFADWPNPGVPAVAAGVYAIWEGPQLVYCGMSGRELASAQAALFGAEKSLESNRKLEQANSASKLEVDLAVADADKALKAAGVPHQIFVYEGVSHAFHALAQLS
mgnify:CR=1 FL=1